MNPGPRPRKRKEEKICGESPILVATRDHTIGGEPDRHSGQTPSTAPDQSLRVTNRVEIASGKDWARVDKMKGDTPRRRGGAMYRMSRKVPGWSGRKVKYSKRHHSEKRSIEQNKHRDLRGRVEKPENEMAPQRLIPRTSRGERRANRIIGKKEQGSRREKGGFPSIVSLDKNRGPKAAGGQSLQTNPERCAYRKSVAGKTREKEEKPSGKRRRGVLHGSENFLAEYP